MAKAVVFGAAGVTGWGLCRALLEYPTRHSFSSVIGLTLHPVSKDEDYFTDDDRLSTHTGIDLTVSEQEVQQQLSQIPGFADATHVYYVACGLSPTYDFEETAQINLRMFQTALQVTAGLCERLEHFSWQSGSLWYGGPFRAQVEEMGMKLPPHPFTESGPRVPDPIGGMIPFYKQHDMIDHYYDNKYRRPSWSWTSPRADTIIGFAPHVSPHNLALSLGSYLAIVRLLSPTGTEVPFPGTMASYQAPFTVTTQLNLAQTTIQLSLASKTLPHLCGEAFNIATHSSAPLTWEYLWPLLLPFFGLRGKEPISDQNGLPFGAEWVESKRHELANAEGQTLNLIPGLATRIPWQYLQFLLGADIERSLDTTKVKALADENGWRIEQQKPENAFFEAWKQAQASHLLPTF